MWSHLNSIYITFLGTINPPSKHALQDPAKYHGTLQSGRCRWHVAIQMDGSYFSVQILATLLVSACPGTLVGAQIPL